MKIKAFLLKVKLFIMNIILRVKEILPVGIEVVNKIKTFVDSPTADVLTMIIPGAWDDRLVMLLRRYLPIVLFELEDCEEFIGLPDNEKLRMIILKLNSYSKAKRNALYLNIASTLNMHLANGQVSKPESILATQSYYENLQIAA